MFNSPPGAADPYFCAHCAFDQIVKSTLRNVAGCGPFSAKLPQPTTVPFWPI